MTALAAAILPAQQPVIPVPTNQSAPGGQPPATPDPQQPVFRTGINYVRVDVIVTDRQGTPVADLRQADFEVTEDGKPQTIDAFRLIKHDATRPVEVLGKIRSRADEETAASNEDARIFVFFLDDYHVRLGNSMASRRHLIDFVQTRLAPNDLVAVMYPLSPLDTVTLTRDHQSIIRMIERFEGRKFNYEPRNSTEQRYSLYPAETVERIRRQVSLSALEGLAVKLGSLREGRKAVILISEGYTAMLPPQLRDPVATMPGLGNPARGNPNAGTNSTLEDRASFLGEVDVNQELQDVFNAANRSNTAIYAVDPRGLATGEFDINENVTMQRSQESLRQTLDTLRVLADETDGRAIINRNDLAKGMQQIVTDSSAYYLLGYNSSQAPQDGKFHEIKVRVKRPGVQVRARKGYWALTASDTARVNSPAKAGPPPAVNRALASIAEPTNSRLIRTWLGTSRGAGGMTRVTFVWEPIPAQPGVRRGTATHVTLLAQSLDGEVYFKGRVPDTDAPATTDAAAATSTAARSSSATFEAPPGRIQLRMAIDGSTGLLDNDSREMIVPDLTAPEIRLGTPQVFVARTAREFQILAKDAAALPTASRDFRRTERLLVRGEVFGPEAAAITVTVRLLNRGGQKMADVPLASAGTPYTVDLSLASLAPGEYLLEISTTAEGQQPATELIAFRVGS
jgi:VWFA-related protein